MVILSTYVLRIKCDIPCNLWMKEYMNAELRKMRRETQHLELSLQRYTGEDLRCVRFDDLVELEHQLEESVNRVRARKVIFHCLLITISLGECYWHTYFYFSHNLPNFLPSDKMNWRRSMGKINKSVIEVKISV